MVEAYIPFVNDLADFLANIRASYDIWLREGGVAKLTTASLQGTLSGAIVEVRIQVYIQQISPPLHRSFMATLNVQQHVRPLEGKINVLLSRGSGSNIESLEWPGNEAK